MKLVKINVEEAQNKQKRWFDKKKSVKKSGVRVGDMVSIKSPVHMSKGSSKFGPPVKVIQVCGNAIRVGNGNWWNLCKVVKITQQDHLLYEKGRSEGSRVKGDGESQRQTEENLTKLRPRSEIIKPARYRN